MYGSVRARMVADGNAYAAMESGVVTPSLQALHWHESFRGRSLYGATVTEEIPHRIDRPGP